MQYEPERSLLFYGGSRLRCGPFAARRCRREIRRALAWAGENGVTVFFADYMTAYGRLALEELCRRRSRGEEFRLYAAKTAEPFSRRITARMWERLAALTARCDGMEALETALRTAGYISDGRVLRRRETE